MGRFSQYSDIDAVLGKASGALPKIEDEYSKYLKEQKIPDNLLVDVKDYLSNLRSALDYLWHKIPATNGDHFPVANSDADFSKKTNGVNTQIVLALKSIQDYNPNSWIRCFNLFRNKNAHITLIPQKRIETPALSIQHNGVGMSLSGGAQIQIGHGTSISLGGATIEGGQAITPHTDKIIGDPRLKIKKEIWVNFIFDGSSISPDLPANISALPFLKESWTKTQSIISELEKKL